MKFSIVMTTCNRDTFLRYALGSLQRQGLGQMDHEVIVANDGHREETESLCRTSPVVAGLNVRHIHTGTRTQAYWRCMGFAANVGIQQATGEIVVLTNSDIFHIGETLRPVIAAAENDRMAMSTLHDVYDDDGRLVTLLGKAKATVAHHLGEVVDRIRKGPRPPGFYPANPDVPFFLAVRREHLLYVGGYDEDFIGCASEDCDLLDRLQAIGCRYVYAPPGAEAIHLYHGRRGIKELEADPGFAYNIRLRKERAGQLVRNVNRPWGELIDSHAPWDGAPLHLVLWVTSRCNLACPHCNQAVTRSERPDYEMGRDELEQFIESCRSRGIHFATIELSGGEPTLWPLFAESIGLLQESGITDAVTFVTNGRDAANVAETANRYGLRYVVSANQCTAEDADTHRRLGVAVTWNELPHRVPPTEVQVGCLPADCSQRRDSSGRVVRQLMYLYGNVWYCCMAFANHRHIGADAGSLHCGFDEDFNARFHKRADDLPICGACLCNNNVWRQLEE